MPVSPFRNPHRHPLLSPDPDNRRHLHCFRRPRRPTAFSGTEIPPQGPSSDLPFLHRLRRPYPKTPAITPPIATLHSPHNNAGSPDFSSPEAHAGSPSNPAFPLFPPSVASSKSGCSSHHRHREIPSVRPSSGFPLLAESPPHYLHLHSTTPTPQSPSVPESHLQDPSTSLLIS